MEIKSNQEVQKEMETWIIVALIIGLLLIAGVVIATTSLTTVDKQETIQCSGCGNSCTANRNCGLQSCGAVTGGGGCGCR